MNLIIGDPPHPKPSPCLKAIEAQAGWMDGRPLTRSGILTSPRRRKRSNADLTRASSVEGGGGEGFDETAHVNNKPETRAGGRSGTRGTSGVLSLQSLRPKDDNLCACDLIEFR